MIKVFNCSGFHYNS